MTPTRDQNRRPRRGLRRRARSGERGAALVEFALISVPLFTILFGTIEFGWAFFQLNDIRHGAREGLRIVSVYSDVVPDGFAASMTEGERLAQATCERMDQSDGVTITIDLTDSDANGDYDVGDEVELTASKSIDQLTNVFTAILDDVVLEETVSSRLEQPIPDDPLVTDINDVDGTSWTCT